MRTSICGLPLPYKLTMTAGILWVKKVLIIGGVASASADLLHFTIAMWVPCGFTDEHCVLQIVHSCRLKTHVCDYSCRFINYTSSRTAVVI